MELTGMIAGPGLIGRGLARLQQPLDRFYARCHPGPLARNLIGAAAPLVRAMKPNDKWSLGVHAPHWMEACHLPPIEPRPMSRRIFMLAAYRGQFSMELPLAALLAWRGHRITLGWLPKLGSPIKPPLVDHVSAAPYLAHSLAGIAKASGGRVEAIDLTSYAERGRIVSEDFLRRQALADTRMAMMRETVREDDPEMLALFDHFHANGGLAQRAVSGLMAKRRGDFDMGLIANGSTFENANACEVLRHYELPFNTMEKFAFRRVRIVNHGDDFRAFVDLDALWNRRKELGYVGEYREFAVRQAGKLMDERRRSSTTTWAWSLQRAPDQVAEAALAEAGIDPRRPFALVCTNVPYDAGYDKLCKYFPSMRDWLIHTVHVLMERTDLQVVVRCHPAEAAYWGGKERSEDNLAAAGFVPGGRLVVIPGAKSTNTYGLMEHCKFGAVFSSTTGLEMAMIGRRVLVGADVYYARRGFTTDVVDAREHESKLVALAAEPGMLAIDDEATKDAALFHFMLHYVMQWPFPIDKSGDTQYLTPARLVKTGAIRRWLPTIDALATPPAEFHARLPEFLSVARCLHLPRPEVRT